MHQEYLVKSNVVPVATVDEDVSTMRDLKICLDKLKPEYREVILLVGLENLSYKIVAEVTGVPIGTVMSRLSRGREELRQLMSSDSQPKLVSVK